MYVCACSRSGVIEKLEALELENPEKMEVEESGRSGARQGRSEHRRFHREVTWLRLCARIGSNSASIVQQFTIDTVTVVNSDLKHYHMAETKQSQESFLFFFL